MSNSGPVIPLHEGVFSVGWDKKFNRISKSDPPAKGALKIALNPFLIKMDDRLILIDCGLGSFGEENHIQILCRNLDDLGYSEHDITDVVCSHLHYDHIGGLAHTTNGYWELTFPDATIRASRNGWDKLRRVRNEDDPQADFVDFIEARADLAFLDDNDSPIPYISTETIGGHTEFSQLIEVKIDGRMYMMAGDVMATRGAVNRRYAAKYDFDGKRSMQLREQLARRAYEENAVILAYHDYENPMFELTDFDKDRGYTIKNVHP